MPPEGFADPVTGDRTGFHSNMSASKLAKHVTRAIEAGGVNSTPPDCENHGRGDSHKKEPTLDQIPAHRVRSRVGSSL